MEDNFGLYSGDLYRVIWGFGVCSLSSDGETLLFYLKQDDIFLLIDYLEIEEINVIECQILFENKKMWFNIQRNFDNIDNVKRAESYDIPFTALRNNEPGSNSFSLTV
jgi:hypothetical protein